MTRRRNQLSESSLSGNDPIADIEQSAPISFMAIERRRLFEEARDRWPRSIRIYPTKGFPSFDAEPSLVEVHTVIQSACQPKGEWTQQDEWIGLANWSFHQALWAVAEEAVAERQLDRDEVTFDRFDECMRSNLSDDSWAAERQEYEVSPLLFH